MAKLDFNRWRAGVFMLIRENRQLTPDIFALDLTGDFSFEKATPGQFVNVLIGDGSAHPLRRPISIASCEPETQTLILVYRVVGDGTKWLSERSVGDVVDVLGPLGKGFSQPRNRGRVLVVGGGVGIPPLYQLAKTLAADDFKLDIVLGFRSEDDVFCTSEFAEFGDVIVCTEDGSIGEKGFVTAALEMDKDWKTLYSCGPTPMLKALKLHFQGRDMQGYVSIEERMACGVGACWGCTCLDPTGSVAKRICKEGPVFPWEEVAL